MLNLNKGTRHGYLILIYVLQHSALAMLLTFVSVLLANVSYWTMVSLPKITMPLSLLLIIQRLS